MLLLAAGDLVWGERATSPSGTWTASSSVVGAHGKLEPYKTTLVLSPTSDRNAFGVTMTLALPDETAHFQTTGKLQGNVLSFDGSWGGRGLVHVLELGLGGGPKKIHAEYTFTQDGSGELLEGNWTYDGKNGHEAVRRAGSGWAESYMGGSPASEQAIIADLASRVNVLQDKTAKDTKDPVERGFHAKGKGLKAEFHINSDIAPDLQAGFFKPGAVYPAIIRFSNAGSKVASDTAPDERGLAIRVKTGTVSRLLSGATADAQDFLTTNSDVTARNPVQFLDVATALGELQEGDIEGAKAVLAKYGLPETAYATYKVALHTDFAKKSYTDEKIWSSRAPIKWGSLAVKFQLTPNDGTLLDRLALEGEKLEETGTVAFDSNHLSDNLASRLKDGPITLDFAIQRFQSEQTTPIEDASIEWKSPVEKVAQLVIVKQDMDDATAKALAAEIEKMAFNPWNCTETFRPLGSIMRARRVVYAASADHRGACPFGFGQ
jgi:hypothetical protein